MSWDPSGLVSTKCDNGGDDFDDGGDDDGRDDGGGDLGPIRVGVHKVGEARLVRGVDVGQEHNHGDLHHDYGDLHHHLVRGVDVGQEARERQTILFCVSSL